MPVTTATNHSSGEEEKDFRQSVSINDMDENKTPEKNVAIAIDHKDEDWGIQGRDSGDTVTADASDEALPKSGVFDIFMYADTTDILCISFAVFCSALSGANQVSKDFFIDMFTCILVDIIFSYIYPLIS